jgi:hypothetical protein
LSNEEKTKDYENFEKGMIYIKILKKGGVVEKGGRRKRNPCPMRLWITVFKHYTLRKQCDFLHLSYILTIIIRQK